MPYDIMATGKTPALIISLLDMSASMSQPLGNKRRIDVVMDALTAALRELQDYRSYLQYDIRIHYPNSDRALLSQINAKKSGGETTTPFYVAMAASFAQA